MSDPLVSPFKLHIANLFKTLLCLILLCKVSYASLAVWQRQNVGTVYHSTFSTTGASNVDPSLTVATVHGGVADLDLGSGSIKWRHFAEPAHYIASVFTTKHALNPSTLVLTRTKRGASSKDTIVACNLYDRSGSLIHQVDLNLKTTVNLHSNRLKDHNYGQRIFDFDKVQSSFYGIESELFDKPSMVTDAILINKGGNWVISASNYGIKVLCVETGDYSAFPIDLDGLRDASDLVGPSGLERSDPELHLRLCRAMESTIESNPILDRSDQELYFSIAVFHSKRLIGFILLTYNMRNHELDQAECVASEGIDEDEVVIDQRVGNEMVVTLYGAQSVWSGGVRSFFLDFQWVNQDRNEVVNETVAIDALTCHLGQASLHKNAFVVYARLAPNSEKESHVTTVAYLQTSNLVRLSLDGIWVIVEDTQIPTPNPNILVASKQGTTLTITAIDTATGTTSKHKSLVLRGSATNEQDLISLALYERVGKKKRVHRLLHVSLGDGLMQLYKNDKLIWERDEGLAFVTASAILLLDPLMDTIASYVGSESSKSSRQSSHIFHSIFRLLKIYLIDPADIKAIAKAITSRIAKACSIAASYLRLKGSVRKFRTKGIDSISRLASIFVHNWHRTIADTKMEGEEEKGTLTPNYSMRLVEDPEEIRAYYRNHIVEAEEVSARTGSIILMLTAVNKLCAVHDVSGRVIWVRSMGEGSNHRLTNTVDIHSGYERGQILFQTLDEGYRVVVDNKCFLVVSSRQNVCLLCNDVGMVKWVSVVEGVEVGSKVVGEWMKSVVPLWSEVSSKETEDVVLAFGLSGTLYLISPRGVTPIGARKISNDEKISYEAPSDPAALRMLIKSDLIHVRETGEGRWSGLAIRESKTDQLETKSGERKEGGENNIQTPQLIPIWTINFRDSDRRVVIAETQSHPLITNLSYNIATDFTIFSKLISPHLVLFITDELGGGSRILANPMLHLVDTKTGHIFYEEILEPGMQLPLNIQFHDNTIDLCYYSSKQFRNILHTIDLYRAHMRSVVELAIEGLKGGLEARGVLDLPKVFVTSYILPFGVRTMKVTKTNLNISNKFVIFSFNSSQVNLVPKAIINATDYTQMKSVDREIKKELIWNQIYTNRGYDLYRHGRSICVRPEQLGTFEGINSLNVNSIETVGSKWESRSLALLYGLDLAYCYVQAIGEFHIHKYPILVPFIQTLLLVAFGSLVYLSVRKHRSYKGFIFDRH